MVPMPVDDVDQRLNGKVALVTAASEGLGLACARSLARLGCTVAICGRRQDALDEARRTLEADARAPVAAIQADLTRNADLEALVEHVRAGFGGPDILIVNSGHIPYGGLSDLEDRQWYEAFDLLLMSAVRLVRLVLPAMRQCGGGDVVFIGSATVREPSPHLLLSTVMRLGVAGLAKTLARSLAPENIRVNLVSPGYFDTGRVRRRIDQLAADKGLAREQAITEIAGDIPFGRIGRAEELAELVAFIASRRAAFMTGATIAIDGGAGRSIL